MDILSAVNVKGKENTMTFALQIIRVTQMSQMFRVKSKKVKNKEVKKHQ